MTRHPLLYALAAIVLWASLATLGAAVSSLPPFFTVGVSLMIGSLCALKHWREWQVPPATLLLGVAGLFGYHFFLFLAFRLAPAVEANLLNYLWPLLIVLLSPVLLSGYHLSARHILGALAGFAGAALVVTGGQLSINLAALPGYGSAVLAALLWACYSLLTKRVRPFPTAAIGGFCLLSGVLSLLCHTLMEPAVSPSASQWLTLLLLGAGPMGLAFFLWDKALKLGDPRQIGALSYLTPLLSTLLLVASGRGQLGPATGAAIALIVGGALAGTLDWQALRRKRKHPGY
jgi:drug/metabolite transporter (DMT)-like permease